MPIDDLCITRAVVHNTEIPLPISKLVDVRQIEENREESSTFDLDLPAQLTFIHCQIENVLVPKNRRKYNVVTVILSLKRELISPAA